MKHQLFIQMLMLCLLSSCVTYHGPDDKNVKEYFIESNKHKIHLIEKGTGPSIIFSGGNNVNDPFNDLKQVILPISRIARTVTYERPGHGKSESTIIPRTIDIVTSEIDDVLSKAGILTPYILVGHSMASLELIHYAQKYPEKVKSIVLIDGAPPSFYKVFKIPNNILINLYLFFFPGAPGAVFEGKYVHENAEIVMKKGIINNIPITYIYAGANGITNWYEYQNEFTNYSIISKAVYVSDANHFIHHKHPEIIIKEIIDFISNKGI